MVSKRWPWRRSTFREANRVSLDALSQQLPLRLIEAVMPHFRSRQLNSWVAYWLPRSLWKIGPAFLSGLRRNQAISSASMTRLLCISDCIDQPTTRRLNRPITTARNSQPSLVGMWVMSPVHARFGAAIAKLRFSRLGAIGKPCRLSVVVTRKRRLPRGGGPAVVGCPVPRCLLATPSALQPTNKVLVVARHTYPQHPALHTDRPHTPIASNQGVLHFCPLAKYAIAFPRMSRSIVTRANSARKRLISICSAVTFDRLSPPFSVPSR